MEDRNQLNFDKLYTKFSKLVFHIAYIKVLNYHLAEDITQEVFLKLHKNLDLLNNLEHAKVWLIRVTATTIIDFIRKQPSEVIQTIEENNNTFDKDVLENSILFWDSQKRVDEVLEKMRRKNPRWYDITVDVYYMGLDNDELSEKYHLNKNALSSLLYRIRKWLCKEILEQNKDLKKFYDALMKKL